MSDVYVFSDKKRIHVYVYSEFITIKGTFLVTKVYFFCKVYVYGDIEKIKDTFMVTIVYICCKLYTIANDDKIYTK